MKRMVLIAMIFAIVAAAPGVASAGEPIGTNTQDVYTSFNFGAGTAFPARRIVAKAASDTGKVISVLRSDASAEIYSVSSLAHGGRFNMATSSNEEVVQLNTAGTSFIVGSLVGINTKTPATIMDINGDCTVRGVMTSEVVEIAGAGALDLAESFKVNADEIQPGMVVAIDSANPGELTVANKAYDRKVAGIISGAGNLRAGLQLGGELMAEDGHQPVALSGRVWCWVDTAYTGPVAPGDSLTTSATPGHAMKVVDYDAAQGAVIGKAMTGLDNGKGLVLVLVNLH